MGRFGADGSFGVLMLAGIFHGPLYIAFSATYRASSLSALASHEPLSSFDKSFQASDTSLAIFVVF